MNIERNIRRKGVHSFSAKKCRSGFGFSMRDDSWADMFPHTLAYDLFPYTVDIQAIVSRHVETAVLLSKGEIDSKKIRVEFSPEDREASDFQ